MKKAISFIKQDRIVHFFEIMLFIFLFYSFFTMYYSDILITCEHSINFLNCLFNGEILNFYDYAKVNSSFGTNAYYDILVYIIFGIWNLPIYLLKTFGGISIFNPVVLLWYKLLVVIFLCLCILYARKICSICTNDQNKEKYITLFLLSSLLIIVPTLQVAQYDDIYILLILMGTYSLMKKEKKKFVLFFALAMPIKFFSLLFFIPLLFISEKRIGRIIFNVGCLGIGPLLAGFLFHKSIAYGEISQFTRNYFFDVFFSTNLKVAGVEGISFFAIAYLSICVYAYAIKVDDYTEKTYIKVLFLVASAMFVLCDTTPYWLIILGFFIIIYVFICVDDIEVGLWLEYIISVCFFTCGIFRTNWVFGGQKTFSYLFLRKWYKGDGGNIGTMLCAIGIHNLIPIITGILVGSIVMLVIVNQFAHSKNNQNEVIYRGHFMLRVATVVAWCLLETKILLF